MLVSKKGFQEFIKDADLQKRSVRKKIKTLVIDEVIKTRYIVDYIENPLINLSGDIYLRPCPTVIFGDNGWEVRIYAKWFAK